MFRRRGLFLSDLPSVEWIEYVKEIEAALVDAIDLIPDLAEQQAMPDDWWRERWRKMDAIPIPGSRDFR